MKYSFALAVLLAVVTPVSAIHMSAEPVLKKEEPKKDEAAIKAKFDAVKAKKEALDDKAVATETAKMNADEAAVDSAKDAYATKYWKNVAEQ